MPQALIKILPASHSFCHLQECETSQIRPLILLLPVEYGLSGGMCFIATGSSGCCDQQSRLWLHMWIAGILLLPNSIDLLLSSTLTAGVALKKLSLCGQLGRKAGSEGK